MSRQNEIDCLEKVKSAFFRSEQAKIEFNNSNASFGSILLSSKCNNDSSKFPDFFFDGGIIEHFQVTASAESKKGSSFKIKERINDRQAQENFKITDDQFRSSEYMPYTLSVAENRDEYDNFSYDDFLISFKKNFIKHNDSLTKSNYLNQVVVFMIEQDDSRLGVWQNNHFLHFYHIYEDKEVLSFLKQYSNNVRYVIFIAVDGIEIIDLNNIENLILKAKDNLDIRSGHSTHLKLKLYIDI